MNKFFQTPAGRVVSVVAILVGLGAVVWSVKSNFGPDAATAEANNPTFINAETGKVFHLAVGPGTHYPVKCPDTGKETGYAAELCYWTADGQPKSTPTPVLLNGDKQMPEPTFCPDCGRLVIRHNPIPVEGRKAPPTEAQYNARHPQ